MRRRPSSPPLLASLLLAPLAVLAVLAGGCGHADAPHASFPSGPGAPSVDASSPSPAAAAASSTAPPASTIARSWAVGDESDPAHGDLAATIELAIAMLEHKEHRAFLERFIAPEDRRKLLEDGGIDALLPSFAADKADALLEILRDLRGRSPRREGQRAIFDRGGNKEVIWVFANGRWYIKN